MGLLKGEITDTPFAEVVANRKTLDLRLLALAWVFSKLKTFGAKPL